MPQSVAGYPSKPPYGAPVDRRAPIAQGLLAFWPFAIPALPAWDAIGGLPMAAEGTPTWSIGPCGVALNCTSTASGASATPPARLQVGFPLTIAVGWRYQGASAGSSFVCGLDYASNSHTLAQYVTSGGVLEVAGPGTGSVGVTYSPTAGRDYVTAADSTTSAQNLWVNGANVSQSSAALSSPSYTSASLYVGQNPGGGSRPENLWVYWFAAWNRLLSAGEEQAVGAGPSAIFRLLYPRVDSYTYPATAAAFAPWIWGDQIEANATG